MLKIESAISPVRKDGQADVTLDQNSLESSWQTVGRSSSVEKGGRRQSRSCLQQRPSDLSTQRSFPKFRWSAANLFPETGREVIAVGKSPRTGYSGNRHRRIQQQPPGVIDPQRIQETHRRLPRPPDEQPVKCAHRKKGVISKRRKSDLVHVVLLHVAENLLQHDRIGPPGPRSEGRKVVGELKNDLHETGDTEKVASCQVGFQNIVKLFEFQRDRRQFRLVEQQMRRGLLMQKQRPVSGIGFNIVQRQAGS